MSSRKRKRCRFVGCKNRTHYIALVGPTYIPVRLCHLHLHEDDLLAKLKPHTFRAERGPR